jgi:hypothetical protein
MEVWMLLGAIFGAILIGAMSPGPSFVLVARTAVAVSRPAGIATALGMGLGTDAAQARQAKSRGEDDRGAGREGGPLQRRRSDGSAAPEREGQGSQGSCTQHFIGKQEDEQVAREIEGSQTQGYLKHADSGTAIRHGRGVLTVGRLHG